MCSTGVTYTIIVLMAIAASIVAPPTFRLGGTGLEGRRGAATAGTGGGDQQERRSCVRAHPAPEPGWPELDRRRPGAAGSAWPESAPATILSVIDGGRARAETCNRVLNVLAERETTAGRPNEDAVGAVIEEDQLGYGVIGVGATGADTGASGVDGETSLLSPMVDDILRRCELPTVIVRRARQLGTTLPSAYGRALVPVTGSQGSCASPRRWR